MSKTLRLKGDLLHNCEISLEIPINQPGTTIDAVVLEKSNTQGKDLVSGKVLKKNSQAVLFDTKTNQQLTSSQLLDNGDSLIFKLNNENSDKTERGHHIEVELTNTNLIDSDCQINFTASKIS